MNIKILYDNKALSPEYACGWGFSCLIDERVLFDTGEKGDALIANMEKCSVDIKKIEMIVISHEHRDYVGGLWEILKQKPQLPVYCPSNVSDDFKNKVKEAKGRFIACTSLTKIVPDIYVTGDMTGRYKLRYLPEQALIIKSSEGLLVVTGCAHQDIIAVIEKVNALFPDESIALVMGGFHMSGYTKNEVLEVIQFFQNQSVKKVGPSHCTGAAAENLFRNKYDKNFIALKAGLVFDI